MTVQAVVLLLGVLQAEENTGWNSEWFPDDLLYRHYMADPRAPHTGSRIQAPLLREDNTTIENVLGQHRSLIRWERPGKAFEIEAEAAVFSRFDFNENMDMDGLDYRVGLPIVYREGDWALKLHPWHLTSHLGDEIIERKGLRRIKYARNAVALGVSWWAEEEVRLYAEGGVGFALGKPNKPGRAQAGFEVVSDILGPDAPDFYVAGNVTSYEAVDWQVHITAQAGLWIRPRETTWGIRVGPEYFWGRTALTQFLGKHDHYVSIGFWIHF